MMLCMLYIDFNHRVWGLQKLLNELKLTLRAVTWIKGFPDVDLQYMSYGFPSCNSLNIAIVSIKSVYYNNNNNNNLT